MLGMYTRSEISAILPSYNEARNVRTVLDVLQRSDFLDELILVDDGSDDETLAILQDFAGQEARARVLHHETNLGKGQAVFTGWAAASGSVILLLDSDLKNLTPDHLRALLAPILDHRADMTLGVFRGGHINTDFSHWATPFLTGQRALRADLLKHVSRAASAGYGFEVALTVAARQAGYRTRLVPLRGVWHPPSEFHRGGWNGARQRMRMYSQIIHAWWVASSEQHPKMRQFFSSRLRF